MNAFFSALYHWISTHKLWSVLLFVAFGLALAAGLTQLRFEEDITKLIPSSPETKKLQRILDATQFSDKVIVTITNESGSFIETAEYAQSFIEKINPLQDQYIQKIQGKVTDESIEETLEFIYQNLPIFLTEDEYVYLEQNSTADSIQKMIESHLKSIMSPSGMLTKEYLMRDPFGLTFKGMEGLQDLSVGPDFKLKNGFVTTANESHILLFLSPKLAASETQNNNAFADALYQIQEDLNTTYAGKASSRYFGGLLIAVANASQIKSDIQITIGISMAILMLILIVYYKKIITPLILFLPTLVGGALAGVVLVLIRPKISAISLGLGSVLLGITLDYSLHILTHLKHQSNIKMLYQDVTKPILMSSITTAIAFLCLLFIPSTALQDLGIFAAVSVLGAATSALILIPQLYTPKATKGLRSNTLIDKLSKVPLHRYKLVLGLVFVGILFSLFGFHKVKFNNDIATLNFVPKELQEAEKALDSLTSFSSKSLYVVAYNAEEEEALSINREVYKTLAALHKENKIIQFSSVGNLVLSRANQEDKIDRWNRYWSNSRKDEVKSNFVAEGAKIGFKAQAYAPFYKHLEKEFTAIPAVNYKAIGTLYLDDYLSTKPNFSTVTTLVKVSHENVAAVKKQFESVDGVQVIDRKEVNETFLGNLKSDFDVLILLSLSAVVLLLFLFYRSLSLTLITCLPIAFTWVLTLGVMHAFGLTFNVFNIIITTFIFGLGIDYSIFITNALRKEYTYGSNELPLFKSAIILSVLTTVLGVGALVFAKHPALYSISVISLIGILITALVAFTIQPFLFHVFIIDRAKRGYSPIKFIVFIRSMFLLLFYALGGIFLSVLSLVLVVVPISKKKKFTFVHKLIKIFVSSVLGAHVLAKKKYNNLYEETFEKPAILIANHASSLDTLSLFSMAYNIVFMVNDWVYRSPIFGVLARVLGFFPVSNGVDESTTHLEEKIKQGYILGIFPEGKRSKTNKIGRFHKGAFFLQEQLKIDIIPVYIHGNSEVMPKGDFMIYEGRITVEVGKRIAYDDTSFGTSYKERTKKIGAFYKKNFKSFRAKLEDENYYKRILFSNYIFKQKELLETVKHQFSSTKTKYLEGIRVLPEKARIVHIAEDCGQWDIMLVSHSLDRKITSIYSTKEHYTIAKNCFTLNTRNVKVSTAFTEQIASKNKILLITSTAWKLQLTKEQMLNFNEIIVLDKVEIPEYVYQQFVLEKTTVYFKFFKRNYD